MTALLAPTVIIAGIAALAGILYLLQRLRVRHRPVRVVSTLFWREAVEEARARVLVERFRHPLAYLLLLGIVTLVWFAATGVDLDRRTGDRHLVLIDASARMSEPERFAETVALARETVAALPRARRQVILCAGEPHTLLVPGEPERLFDLRLAAYGPEACPPTLERTLADHLPTLTDSRAATVWVAGDSPLSPAILAIIPDSVTVVPLVAPRAGRSNRGIVALGVAQAESGTWERIDILVEVAGNGAETAELAARIDGAAISGGAERDSAPGGTRFIFRDLPATGGRFEAGLVGADDNPLDDRAARTLPVRRPLRVALSPSLAPWLEPALAADPAVRLVTGEADVAVRRGGEAIGGQIPALEFVPRDAQEESILLAHDATDDSARVLEEALLDLGLDQVDAMDLAAAAGRPITLGARPAGQRGIGVWEELLAEDYNFVSSRSFPLFVALSLRWILEVEDLTAEVAAGRPLSGHHRLASGGLVLDPVGDSARAPRAGEYADDRGGSLSVGLLDRIVTAGAEAIPSADEFPPPGPTTPFPTVLGLLALALLAGEWFLYRRGAIP